MSPDALAKLIKSLFKIHKYGNELKKHRDAIKKLKKGQAPSESKKAVEAKKFLSAKLKDLEKIAQQGVAFTIPNLPEGTKDKNNPKVKAAFQNMEAQLNLAKTQQSELEKYQNLGKKVAQYCSETSNLFLKIAKTAPTFLKAKFLFASQEILSLGSPWNSLEDVSRRALYKIRPQITLFEKEIKGAKASYGL